MEKQQQKSKQTTAQPLVNLQDELKDAVTINKTPAKVFEFISNFENYPLFMKGLIEVKKIDKETFHWIFGDRDNKLIEWDTKIVQEIPGSMVKWESVKGASVKQSGLFVVSRASGGRGAVVQMKFEDSMTKSQFREIFEDLTSDEKEFSAHTNLRRLKAYLECGEVPTTEGQPTGRDADAETLKH